MRRKLVLVAALMGWASLGFSQHVLKGQVKNERGKAPGVIVELKDDADQLNSLRTDMDGEYRFEVEKAGRYELTVKESGHNPATYVAEVADQEVIHVKNFTLEPENKMTYRIPDFYFYPEEAELTDHGKEMVYQVGKVLKTMPEVKLELLPEPEKNPSQDALTQEKELIVKKYLIKLGINEERFAADASSKRS